jgi:hypothetical protein
MLVRYRTTGNQTLANFKQDLNAIITGGVAAATDLTAPARTFSTIFGTYPAGIYSRVNATTFTYSKAHNVIAGYTHYFRFGFSATQLTTWDLAQSYSSGTDTLLNTFQRTGLNINPSVNYDPNYPIGMDIIVSNKGIFIQAVQSNQMLGIFDIGHSGVTRAFSSAMLMVLQDMQNVINYGANTGITIPYTYSFDTLSYVTNSTTSHVNITPLKKFTATSQLAVFENPVFCTNTPSGSTINLVYGLYKLPTATFSGIQIYQDASSLYRLSVNDYAILIN